ncbi:hypothetical protein MASR2M79_12210 [Aminivibrio sp.]
MGHTSGRGRERRRRSTGDALPFLPCHDGSAGFAPDGVSAFLTGHLAGIPFSVEKPQGCPSLLKTFLGLLEKGSGEGKGSADPRGLRGNPLFSCPRI